jgi:hypothetical protein
MAATLTPGAPKTKIGKAAVEVDERFLVAPWLRRTLHKVFPDHWSFLLGEIALYSFVVLLLSGTYLTFFFDASMRDVHPPGPPLGGAVVRRVDRGAPAAHLLHRRLPPATGDELADRLHPAAARDR